MLCVYFNIWKYAVKRNFQSDFDPISLFSLAVIWQCHLSTLGVTINPVTRHLLIWCTLHHLNILQLYCKSVPKICLQSVCLGNLSFTYILTKHNLLFLPNYICRRHFSFYAGKCLTFLQLIWKWSAKISYFWQHRRPHYNTFVLLLSRLDA